MNARTVTLTYMPTTGTLSAPEPYELSEDWAALSICSTKGHECHLSQKTFLKLLEHASTIHPTHFDGGVTWIPVSVTVLVTESNGNIIYGFQLTEPIHRMEIGPASEPRRTRKRGHGKINGFQPKDKWHTT